MEGTPSNSIQEGNDGSRESPGAASTHVSSNGHADPGEGGNDGSPQYPGSHSNQVHGHGQASFHSMSPFDHGGFTGTHGLWQTPNLGPMPGFPPMPHFSQMQPFQPMPMPPMGPWPGFGDMLNFGERAGFRNMQRPGNGETFEAFGGFRRTGSNGQVLDSGSFRVENPENSGNIRPASPNVIQAQDVISECEVEEPPDSPAQKSTTSTKVDEKANPTEASASSEGLPEGPGELKAAANCFFGSELSTDALTQLHVISSRDFKPGDDITAVKSDELEVPANIDMRRLMNFLWQGERSGVLVWLRGNGAAVEAKEFKYDDAEVEGVILERLGWKYDDCKEAILVALK